jgi:hypothetical protein
MSKRMLGSMGVVVGFAVASGGVASASISRSLGQFISQKAAAVVSGAQFPNIAGEFLQRVAVGSIQLPVPATSTSFTYQYNPALGIFERSSGSLGPVYVDRAETLGEGKFDTIFSYQFANLTDLDGTNFGKQLEVAFKANVGGAAIGGAFFGKDFSLKENVFAFNFTYGLTDRWDLNLLVPMVYTTLDLAGSAGGFVDQALTVGSFQFHDKAYGIGDILLRTKYRFYDDPNVVRLAAALTLRMPSGNPENFQGLGDFTITPVLIASRPFGRNDLHMNLGMEFDTMNGEGSRARYAIGTTLQPLDRLAFLVDILGSSGLDTQHFSLSSGNVTPICGQGVNCVNYSASKGQVNGVVPRSDIIDLSTGIKFNPFASANVYLLAIIPLNHQGLRAAVVPTGGFEWTF